MYRVSLKIIAFLLVFALHGSTYVFGAIYYSRASGNWNNATSWSTSGYGGAAATSTPGAGVGDIALISGYTITVTASPTNAIGSIVITQSNNTGNDTKLYLNTSGITLTCNTFTVNDNNRNNHLDVEVAQGILQVNGNAVFVRTTSNTRNDRLRLYILNTGRVNVTGNLNYSLNRAQNNSSAGDEIQIEGNGRLDVSGNLTVTTGNTNGNDNEFNFVMNNAAVCNIGGNASFTVSNSDDGDDITIDINGGTYTVSGSFTGTVASTSTSSNSIRFYVDGANVSTGPLAYVQSGGGNGDMNLLLNSNSTLTAATFTVNGDVTFTHNDGDNMEIETNANSTLTVAEDISILVATSSDGDNVYMDLNGGTLSANNGYFTIAGGASNANFFYFNVDGANSLFDGDVYFRQYGGGSGDVNLHLNKNSTSTPTNFTISGDLVFSHSGGDNYEIELNDNSSLSVSGNLIDTLESNDGDDFFIDINGGIFSVNQGFSHFQNTSGSSTEDLNIRVDGNGVFNITGNTYIDHQVGGQVSIYTNDGNGSTAEINIGGDFTIDHGGAANSDYFEIKESSRFTVGGDFLINYYTSGGDIASFILDDNASCIVGGNFTMNLLSGLSSEANNLTVDLNGGTMSVGNNFTLYSAAGNDAALTIDANGTSLTVLGTLSIQNNGGDQSFITLGNANGSPTLNAGALSLMEGGGTRTYCRLYRSSILSVLGDISLNATAAGKVDIGVYSTSQLRIGGNFNRAAVPSRFGILSCAATSTVEYYGSVQQTIAGDAGSGGDGFTYGNVVLNNDDGFIMTALEGNATIPNLSTLTFNSGIVNSTSSGFFVIANGGAVSGASNMSYVDGPIRKVGNSAFTFPIGDNGNYQPASISAPSNVTHHFTGQYFAANPHPTYDNTALTAGLDHISKCEYWFIDRTNGASNVNITLSFDAGSCGVTDLSALRIARWNGTQWVNQGNGGTTGTTSAGTIVNGTAIAGYLSPNSPFTLSSLNSTNPLPVELLDFDAVLQNSKVKLSWITASETNNDFFEVERSSDGIMFQIIGRVKGAGNSNDLRSYTWMDTVPLNNISYYRLKQTDFDGTSDYSVIKMIDIKKALIDETGIVVYPNPIIGQSFNISFTDLETFVQDSTEVMVKLYDEIGRIVYKAELPFSKNENAIYVSMNNRLKSGIYVLNVVVGNVSINKKILMN